MPASKFTRKATTPKLKRQWGHVYNSELRRGASKATAIKAASGVIKRASRKNRRSRRG